MKSFKKNQVIIFVIALMLVSAGYLNYTAIHKDDIAEVNANTTMEYAGIGDAKLVGSNSVQTGNEISTNTAIGSAVTEENTNTTNTNTITTSNSVNKQTDQYFSSSRLGRDTMYSQMIETYQKILENTSISADQKGIAQTEIKTINEQRNAIMITENLIKTKGFLDVVIFINDKSISVMIKAESLENEQIAQIQNIITRELKAEIEDIHISNK